MKNKKIIFVIGIIVIVLLIIILIIWRNNLQKNINQNNNLNKQEEIEYTLDNKLYPNNFTEFYFTYEGKINTDVIYSKFHEIIRNKIPKIYMDLVLLDTDENIEKYYAENNLIDFGINSVEDFKELIKTLKSFKGVEQLQYQICEIEKKSTKSFGDRTEFILNIDYNRCNLKLKVAIYNRYRKNNVFIKITPYLK